MLLLPSIEQYNSFYTYCIQYRHRPQPFRAHFILLYGFLPKIARIKYTVLETMECYGRKKRNIQECKITKKY